MKFPKKMRDRFVFRFNLAFYPAKIMEEVLKNYKVEVEKANNYVVVKAEKEEEIWKISEDLIKEVIS